VLLNEVDALFPGDHGYRSDAALFKR
jgi:hypothetical protein